MVLIRTFLLSVLLLVIKGQSYRLPQNVIPEQYYLDILSYLGEKNNFDFDGRVRIIVTCLRPTTNITLHSKDLEISEDRIQVEDIQHPEKEIKVTGLKEDKDNEFITIMLSDLLAEDHKYRLQIEFKGTMTGGLAGFYRSSYDDKETGKKRWLGVTQFEPVSARRAFPCFDEPAMKARFQINIGRKEGYSAISNMPLMKTDPVEHKQGWFWDRFDNSVPMSTYLVAYIVSDFGYKTADKREGNNVTFNIWARKDALDQVDFARDVGPKALEFFENYFDIKYPLPKQDMIAIPDFNAGAMENWGLITYREAYLLYDPHISSTTSQYDVSSVVAHELAHQWFGNLVTMKWWTDLWLNEGFATYMSGIATDHLFPKWNSLVEESASNLLRVFQFDSLASSHPVSVPIGNPDEIDEIFDTISYKKGSFLIRMMSMFLGDEIFRKGVSDYLKKHKYGNAEQDDLWAALTVRAQESGVLPKDLTVKKIMDSWTVQTGYPVVTVNRIYGSQKAEISQTRFFRDISLLRKGDDSCWYIPVSYTTQAEENFNRTTPKKWMTCPKSKEIIENTGKDDEWLVVNLKSAGLFRVNYDERNWKLLIAKLKSDSYSDIPVLNRVQMIEDSFDLATTGDLPFSIFFNLIAYLNYEDQFVPWEVALSNIGLMKKQLRFSANFANLKTYVQKILTPAYHDRGGFVLKKAAPEKLDTVKHQVLITSTSCTYEVASCIEDAKKLFRAWKDKPDEPNPIPKDLRSIVYCNSVRGGRQDDWDFLWKQYLSSNVATEKNIILTALGCSRELWLLNRYLDWTLDDKSGIRSQDMSRVFSTVTVNDLGFFVSKDWFYKNFMRIKKHLEPNTRRISRFLMSIAGRIITREHLEEFEKFVETNKELLADIRQGVGQALETAKLNVQWQERNKEKIEDILKKHITS